MEIKKQSVCNEHISLGTNIIITVKEENNACMETEKQFAISHAKYLPHHWEEDYYEVFRMRYQQYLNIVHYEVVNHKSTIKLCCADMEAICVSKALITFQTTYFPGNVKLVISDSNDSEVSIFSLNDLGWHSPYSQKFIDYQIDVIELTEKFENLCLTKGQSLTLHTTGGVLLTDHALLSIKAISDN